MTYQEKLAAEAVVYMTLLPFIGLLAFLFGRTIGIKVRPPDFLPRW